MVDDDVNIKHKCSYLDAVATLFNILGVFGTVSTRSTHLKPQNHWLNV
jgi:hypothetical protein